jgi:hypothetical protein
MSARFLEDSIWSLLAVGSLYRRPTARRMHDQYWSLKPSDGGHEMTRAVEMLVPEVDKEQEECGQFRTR